LPPEGGRDLVEDVTNNGPVLKLRWRHQAGLALVLPEYPDLFCGKDCVVYAPQELRVFHGKAVSQFIANPFFARLEMENRDGKKTTDQKRYENRPSHFCFWSKPVFSSLMKRLHFFRPFWSCIKMLVTSRNPPASAARKQSIAKPG
jgi:hypothetical protein